MTRKDSLLEMLDSEPDDPFLNYALALEFQKEQNFTEALRYFRRTIELDKSYTAAYYQLGVLYSDLDIVDVARKYFQDGESAAIEKKDHKTAGEFRAALEEME